MSLTILTNSESIITNALFFHNEISMFLSNCFQKNLNEPYCFLREVHEFLRQYVQYSILPNNLFSNEPSNYLYISYKICISTYNSVHQILSYCYGLLDTLFIIISSLPSFGLGCLTEMTCQTAFFAKFTKARYQNRPKHEPENTKGNLSKSM